VEFYFNSKHTSTEGSLPAASSRDYAPETAEQPERQLFDADLSIVLAMIQAQHDDSQSANNPGLWRLVVAVQIVKAQSNGDKLTLSDLSNQLGISPSHLGRMFQQWTGLTCGGYMLCARMVTAAHLMQTTDKSVQEIVGTLGYRDESGFERDFHRAFGKGPANYKSQIAGWSR
jgi:AraC-like DNA-binding protein